MATKKLGDKHLVERRQVDNSPFLAVKLENDWFLTLGKYRVVNKSFESFEQSVEWINQNNWELIATVASIVADETVTQIITERYPELLK